MLKYKSNILHCEYLPYMGETLYVRGIPLTEIFILDKDNPYKKILDQRLSKSLSDGDIVYFSKTSSTPRDKFKEYCEQKGLNIIRTNRIEYANTIILNENDLKDIVNKSSFTYSIFKMNEEISNLISTKQVKLKYLPVVADIKKYSHLAIETSKWTNITVTGNKIYQALRNNIVEHIDNVIIPQPSYISTYQTVVAAFNGGGKILLDQEITNEYNENDISLENYKQLVSMCEDVTNHKLVAGVIANCNPERNSVAISLILQRIQRQAWELRSTVPLIKNLYSNFETYPIRSSVNRLLEFLLSKRKGVFSETEKEILKESILFEMRKLIHNSPYIDVDIEIKN